MWRVRVRRGGCIVSWWGKPEGMRPLRKHRRRWVDNIKDGAAGGGMWLYGLDWAGPG